MSSPIPFERHPVEWTSEKVGRFWAWFTTTHADDKYFAKLHGEQVLRLVRGHVQGRRVLDFGCGPGFLLEHLVRADFDVTGADMSEESLARARKLVGNRARLVNVKELVASRGDFDVAFLLETIEHLDDRDLATTFETIRGLLRPGGALVITTPNEEDLSSKTVMCPDCGCEFHRVQHVRSISSASLATALERAGLQLTWFTTTNLGPRGIASLRGALHRRLRGKKSDNLIAVAHRV